MREEKVPGPAANADGVGAGRAPLPRSNLGPTFAVPFPLGSPTDVVQHSRKRARHPCEFFCSGLEHGAGPAMRCPTAITSDDATAITGVCVVGVRCPHAPTCCWVHDGRLLLGRGDDHHSRRNHCTAGVKSRANGEVVS